MRREVTVLAYHAVGTNPSGSDPLGLFVPLDRFEWQMSFLARHARVVPAAKLFDPAFKPVRRTVVLTFDDAHRSVATHAAPILRRHGLTATLFVPTASVGGRNTWELGPEYSFAVMAEDELRRSPAARNRARKSWQRAPRPLGSVGRRGGVRSRRIHPFSDRAHRRAPAALRLSVLDRLGRSPGSRGRPVRRRVQLRAAPRRPLRVRTRPRVPGRREALVRAQGLRLVSAPSVVCLRRNRPAARACQTLLAVLAPRESFQVEACPPLPVQARQGRLAREEHPFQLRLSRMDQGVAHGASPEEHAPTRERL